MPTQRKGALQRSSNAPVQALREGARAEGRLPLLLFGLLPADEAPEAGDRRVVDTLVQPAVRTLALGDLQRRRHT